MTYLKKTLLLLFLILTLSGCTATVYYTNWHQLQIPKTETYQVTYITEIPDDTEAKITYTDQDGSVDLKHITGKWVKQIMLPSGKQAAFDVHISSSPAKKLVTSLVVNGQTITEQSQTGKNILFHIAYKLP